MSMRFTRENSVFSYIHLKYCFISNNNYNLTKIFRVNDRTEEYQIKSFIKFDNYFSIIISILFAFISSGFIAAIYLFDLYFNKLFKELTEKHQLIPINQKLEVFLVHF